MAKFSVAISIEIDDSLTAEELWPDGVPENPTLDTVLEVIQRSGGPRKILQDWNLLDDITMDVSLYDDMKCVGSASLADDGRVFSRWPAIKVAK